MATLSCHLRRRSAALLRLVKRQWAFYHHIARHPQTPRFSRWLLLLAGAYLALPFDLIPDFLPVIGHLDDLIIVPSLVAAALLLIPRHVIHDCRAHVMAELSPPQTAP